MMGPDLDLAAFILRAVGELLVDLDHELEAIATKVAEALEVQRKALLAKERAHRAGSTVEALIAVRMYENGERGEVTALRDYFTASETARQARRRTI